MKPQQTVRYAAETRDQALAAWEKDRTSAAAAHYQAVGEPRWIEGEPRPTLEADYVYVAPSPAFGPPASLEATVIRSYEGGSESAARDLFTVDRRTMEAAGYDVASETWSPSGVSRGTILVLGRLAALAPDGGTLTVTYRRHAGSTGSEPSAGGHGRGG